MSFAGGRRKRQKLHYSSFLVAVLIVISVLQIWVCKAGAIRVFPPPGSNVGVNHVEVSKVNEEDQKKNKATKEALFRKFFGGVSASKLNQTEKGFEDSKRRVPSCPDPLHN